MPVSTVRGQFEAPKSRLMGPVKRSCFYLRVILDIDRRRVGGWRVGHAQSAAAFKALLTHAMDKHDVPHDRLT